MPESLTPKTPRHARPHRRVAVAAALLALMVAPLSVAWAQDNTTSDEAKADHVLHMEVGEMYFQLSGQEKNASFTLTSGETYAIEFHNVGHVMHEIQLGRDPGTENGHPHDYQTLLFDGVETTVATGGASTISDTLAEIQLQPDAIATLTFTLPASAAGTWEIGCFQPGHYEAGMHAPVIVQ